MTKYIFAIIVGWIIIIWWQKLLFADKEYIYDESTWWAFIDDAFASSQKEYENALLSWEKIDFVSYSLSGARTIHKTINFPKITNNTTKQPSVWDVKKEHASPASYNLDKLAKCVAVAETSWCTTGMWRTKNNCFGIMHRPNWKRTWKTYSSKQASFDHFKRIWNKSYWAYPNYKLARKRTWWDHTQSRLNTVNSCYKK